MSQYERVWIYCRVARPDIMALESQKQILPDADFYAEIAKITEGYD